MTGQHGRPCSDLSIGLIRDPLSWERWPEAKALLSPALDLSDETWTAVEQQLSDGRAQLGAILQEGGDQLLAAVVFRGITGKAGDVLELFLIGGSQRKRWAAALSSMLREHAAEAGYVQVRAWGRRGWEPLLTSLGWKAPVVGFEMDLAA